MIRSIDLGANGAVYLVGSTSSEDFPVTQDAAQAGSRAKGQGFLVKLVPQ